MSTNSQPACMICGSRWNRFPGVRAMSRTASFLFFLRSTRVRRALPGPKPPAESALPSREARSFGALGEELEKPGAAVRKDQRDVLLDELACHEVAERAERQL